MPMFDINQIIKFATDGGPIVVVLVIMSIAALAVALIKGGQFLLLGVGRENSRLNAAIGHWRAGRQQEAAHALDGQSGFRANVVRTAMAAGADPRPAELVREDIESEALAYLGSLRAYLRVLEASAQLAPLIGLFGTVIGMMAAFKALQSAGAEADPTALAGGIWIALITTAVGLAVAIPAAFVLYWFEGRLAREQTLIETAVTRVLTAPAAVPGRLSETGGGDHAPS